MIGSGIGTNAFDPDLETFMRKLAQFGYSHIYFDHWAFSKSASELEQIAGLYEQYSLQPAGAHSPGRVLPETESKLEEMIAHHKTVLDKAAILGCKSVAFHVASVQGVRYEETGTFIEQVGRAKFDQMNFRTVRELAVYGEKKQVKVAMENLPPDIAANYCRTIDDLKRILTGAGHPNVGICIDTGHANISGLNPGEMIRDAGELLIETHFNDNFGWICPENAVNDIHRPPGIGTVNWLEVVDALHSINYTGPIIFELLPTKFETDEVDTFLTLTKHNWQYLIAAWEFIQKSI